MTVDPNEHLKFVDSAVLNREHEAAMGSLRIALFWAFVGPAAGGLMGLLKYTPGKLLMYGVLATAPLGILLFILYFLKLPPDAKSTGTTITIGLLTLVASVATFIVAHYFSLLKVL